MDEKSYENILIYDIFYKTLICAKPLRIMFDKVDGFIRVYDGTRYLVLSGPEKYDTIYNRLRYLKNQKVGITYLFSHNYAKIKVDSSDFNKDQNHYYYNMFFERCLYQLAKK